ncbi:hypothetical protein Solca_2837 [Solitalea canadensis DSM 3403]|uniref:Uncharacterized protein n=1 Tax=Solitalea canadensis (strain ATCC 29591 / DSM 3403 / JCM 21819 / LMG 8368 / NBRC 15130 / NCIMB 12057 / USAM 9D) TaxID=929556 RepID=H8KS75_SOLCM|nr:hypothetical protein Solca_2837 [Solitalea canadensis DSM 3403]
MKQKTGLIKLYLFFYVAGLRADIKQHGSKPTFLRIIQFNMYVVLLHLIDIALRNERM